MSKKQKDLLLVVPEVEQCVMIVHKDSDPQEDHMNPIQLAAEGMQIGSVEVPSQKDWAVVEGTDSVEQELQMGIVDWVVDQKLQTGHFEHTVDFEQTEGFEQIEDSVQMDLVADQEIDLVEEIDPAEGIDLVEGIDPVEEFDQMDLVAVVVVLVEPSSVGRVVLVVAGTELVVVEQIAGTLFQAGITDQLSSFAVELAVAELVVVVEMLVVALRRETSTQITHDLVVVVVVVDQMDQKVVELVEQELQQREKYLIRCSVVA